MKKYLFLTFLILSMTLTTLSNAQSSAQKYIERFDELALKLMKQTGIPASIILGVSMVESSLGRSKNCKLLNNYFGVKGKNSLHKKGGTYRSAYKEYPNAAASFNDFVRIVKNKKYYPKLKGDRNYKKWLHFMNKHGYATAKGAWITDITQMIEKYNLDDFDKDLGIFDDDTYSIWGVDSTFSND